MTSIAAAAGRDVARCVIDTLRPLKPRVRRFKPWHPIPAQYHHLIAYPGSRP